MAEIINKIAASDNFVSQMSQDLIEAFTNFSDVETIENGKRLFLTDDTYLEILKNDLLTIKAANSYQTVTLSSWHISGTGTSSAYMIIKTESGDIIFRIQPGSDYLDYDGRRVCFVIVNCKNVQTNEDEWCVVVPNAINSEAPNTGYKVEKIMSKDRSSIAESGLGAGYIGHKLTIPTDVADKQSYCIAKNAKICLARQTNNFGNIMLNGKKYFDCFGLLLLDE